MFVSIEEGRQRILDAVTIVPTELVPLGDAYGRVLAMDVIAMDDVPSFDRSPLDGYAFRAEDTAGATRENPVKAASSFAISIAVIKEGATMIFPLLSIDVRAISARSRSGICTSSSF